MFSIIASLIVYIISSYYITRSLDDYLPPGSARKMTVFLIASFISWLVGAGIDWAFPLQAIKLF